MATWVGVIVDAAGRAQLWRDVARFGVTGTGEVGRYVLIDCAARFGRVKKLGQELARALDTETIAFLAQTGADSHAIWVHRGDAWIRTLEYARDYGGWLAREGTPQPWEAAYFGAGDPPTSTANLHALCAALGVSTDHPATYRPPGLLSRLFGRAAV